MPKKLNEENIKKQQEILASIYQILGLSEEKNSFILQDIDVDQDKINAIYELETDIKKNFICGLWTCFRKSKEEQERKWYNMMKSVSKECGIDVYTKRKSKKNNDNIFITVTEVIFEKKINDVTIGTSNQTINKEILDLVIDKVKQTLDEVLKKNDV